MPMAHNTYYSQRLAASLVAQTLTFLSIDLCRRQTQYSFEGTARLPARLSGSFPDVRPKELPRNTG